MSSIDLGKQVGPLPLGAWVAVVGAGLGVALYTRRQSQGTSEPTVVEDTSGVPGVGTGVNGMWTDVTPQPPSNAPTVYTDNDSWGRAAIDRLVADGYPAAQAYSAITKALAGGTGDNQLSVSEFAMWARALVLLKSPPVPVGVPAPSPTTPPSTTPPPTTTPPPGPVIKPRDKYKMAWVSAKVGVPNQTLRQKQVRDLSTAAQAGLYTYNVASANSITLQAAARSGYPPDKIVPVGRWVVIYRMVPK